MATADKKQQEASAADTLQNQDNEQTSQRYVARIVPNPIVQLPQRSITCYNTKRAFRLGWLQIVCAMVIIGLQIAALILDAYGAMGMAGFWGSAVFVVSGTFAIHSSKANSPGSIKRTMVLSFVAAIFAVGVFAQALVGLALEKSHSCEEDDHRYGRSLLKKPDHDDDDDDDCNADIVGRYVVNALMVLFSIMEIILVMLSAYNTALARKQKAQMAPTHSVLYQQDINRGYSNPAMTPVDAIHAIPNDYTAEYSNTSYTGSYHAQTNYSHKYMPSVPYYMPDGATSTAENAPPSYDAVLRENEMQTMMLQAHASPADCNVSTTD